MKKLRVTVEGKSYEVLVEEIEEIEDSKIEKSINKEKFSDSDNQNKVKDNTISKNENQNKDGNNISSSDNSEPIKAPMPGTIVSINVNVGQTVSKGEVLLVLEAMKMENEIVAPKDARVCAINVKKGDSVDSGADLVFLK